MFHDQEYLIRFGLKVRSRRYFLGLSQFELARKSGLNRSYIQLVESGSVNISFLKLLKLCTGLNVSPQELMQELD